MLYIFLYLIALLLALVIVLVSVLWLIRKEKSRYAHDSSRQAPARRDPPDVGARSRDTGRAR
jgi:FtsZ-interacting cell division protein ZipA